MVGALLVLSEWVLLFRGREDIVDDELRDVSETEMQEPSGVARAWAFTKRHVLPIGLAAGALPSSLSALQCLQTHVRASLPVRKDC